MTSTPDFLTVEEAARVLRIGRTAAYQAAKRFRQTNGAEGLPVIAVSGSLRVPRHQLERLAGGPIDLTHSATTTNLDDTTHRRHPHRAIATSSQNALPFTS